MSVPSACMWVCILCVHVGVHPVCACGCASCVCMWVCILCVHVGVHPVCVCVYVCVCPYSGCMEVIVYDFLIRAL